MALPSGYKQGDYIISKGNEYIDTLFTPNQDTKVEIEFSFYQNRDGNKGIFGVRNSANSKNFSTLISGSSVIENDYYYDGYGDANNQIYNVRPAYNTFYTLVKDKRTTSIDDTIITTHNIKTFTCDRTMKMFAIDNGGDLGWKISMYVKKCKIWDNGTLVRDYIPVRRISDNEVGLYDLVNDVFYTNQSGIGAFELNEAPVYYCNIWLKVSDNEVQRIKKVIVK